MVVDLGIWLETLDFLDCDNIFEYLQKFGVNSTLLG